VTAQPVRDGDALSPAEPVPAQLPLHLWRRIDWRFLLPTTTLRTVVCAGRPDDELRAALDLLGGRVVAVGGPAGWAAAAAAAPDLVVLSSPDAADLARAVAAAPPGCWVYAEVRRSPLATDRPRTLLGWRRAFLDAGLVDVATHWHAPDFSITSRMVPLDAPVVVRDALSRHDGIRFGRALSLAGRLALRLGVFPAAVAEGSVLGRRPAGVGTP
jgi:hypothetical protein